MGLTMFISSFIVGYYTSWKLSLVISSIIPFFVIGGIIINIILRNRNKKSKELYEKAGGIAEELIYHIKTVASFANFDFEINRFNESLELSYDKGIKQGKIVSILLGLYFFIIFGTFALAIWYGSVLIYNKELNRSGYDMAIGDILIVIFTIIFGSLALGQIIPNIKVISSACTNAYDFFYLLNRIPEIDLSTSTLKPNPNSITGNITFENVSFSYPSKKDKIVFENINCYLESKKKIAIIGENGSGKSTFANLIERFYDCTSGEIKIDDLNIKNFDIIHLRSLISYATQEPVLFNTSIKDNIKFGREELTDDEIKEVKF